MSFLLSSPHEGHFMAAPTVTQIAGLIEEIAPPSIAMIGDPVGLQCGDPSTPVKKVMYSLDAGTDVVSQAVRKGADLLISHHPMIFKPLDHRAVTGTDGRALVMSIQAGLAVYSAHTNLDASGQGINVEMAGLLGLKNTRLLSPTGPDRFKVVVFVPERSLEKVRTSAFNAGAGQIGDYSSCSFSTPGTGTFFGEEGSRPVLGKAGQLEQVSELRLELVAAADILAGVLEAIRASHPYEEPAMDVYPLARSVATTGLGLVGVLPKSSPVGDVADSLRSSLSLEGMRLVGKAGRKVSKVAVCAGSGASLIEMAASSGAQLFVTGDIKYHEAKNAQELGITLLDVGHFAPEKYGMKRFASLFGRQMGQNGWQVESTFARESDPFVFLP